MTASEPKGRSLGMVLVWAAAGVVGMSWVLGILALAWLAVGHGGWFR